ncbi:hypothetical protein BKA70DRAFT_1427205 [Coprinopsis sp. MPI-PUGE-AT-0042]|nr:hypothetical protein BKA70DRAFT_1427205 [Coprinopsis sp. MPI-PUGE-AT-0042]
MSTLKGVLALFLPHLPGPMTSNPLDNSRSLISAGSTATTEAESQEDVPTSLADRYTLGYATMSFAVSERVYDSSKLRLDTQREVRVYDGEVHNLITVVPHRYSPHDIDHAKVQHLTQQRLSRTDPQDAICIGVINNAIPRGVVSFNQVRDLEYHHDCHGNFPGQVHIINGHHRIAAVRRIHTPVYNAVVEAWKEVDTLQEQGKWWEVDGAKYHATFLTRFYSNECTWLVRVIDIDALLKDEPQNAQRVLESLAA